MISKTTQEVVATLEAAADHITREYATRLWNEHYSWGGARAEAYANENPPSIVRRLRRASKALRAASDLLAACEESHAALRSVVANVANAVWFDSLHRHWLISSAAVEEIQNAAKSGSVTND
jgi:hypothetical protein